jgi:hypothetical protein
LISCKIIWLSSTFLGLFQTLNIAWNPNSRILTPLTSGLPSGKVPAI